MTYRYPNDGPYGFAREGADDPENLRRAPARLAPRLHGAEDGQLFDLETDPHEQHNLWGKPEHVDVISKLKDDFIDWRQNSLLETMDLNAAVR